MIGKKLALALVPAVAACSLLFQIDTPSAGPDASLPDAGAPETDDGARAGCPLLHWPDRPAADDPSGGDVDLTFALRSMELGLGDAGPAPGFDLDGLCTCPDPPSCVEPRGKGPACDRDGGVDNAVFDLLKSLSSFGAAVWNQKLANAVVATGQTGLLFVLHRYNGTANDASVELSLFVSDGTPLAPDGGAHTPARFDGTDVWTVNRSSALNGSGPPIEPVYVDRTAYVAGGVLVANVDFPLNLRGAVNLAIQLLGARIVARVVPGGLARLDDGVIVGRATTGTLLTALAVFEDPFAPGGHLCGDSGTYLGVKGQICDAVDLAARPSDDRAGAPCAALSMGVGFTAVQANVGSLAPVVDGGAPCGWGYQDDCPR